MNNKLVIENREFYFHPTYTCIAYAGSLDSYVVHAITRITTLDVNNEKGYFVEGNWGRCLHVHDFIWECFHGLLKEEVKIKHINKRRDDNRLENLRLCSSSDIVIQGSIYNLYFNFQLH